MLVRRRSALTAVRAQRACPAPEVQGASSAPEAHLAPRAYRIFPLATRLATGASALAGFPCLPLVPESVEEKTGPSAVSAIVPACVLSRCTKLSADRGIPKRARHLFCSADASIRSEKARRRARRRLIGGARAHVRSGCGAHPPFARICATRSFAADQTLSASALA